MMKNKIPVPALTGETEDFLKRAREIKRALGSDEAEILWTEIERLRALLPPAGEWKIVASMRSTALYYPTGATEPTWIISNAENFDRAVDEAGQFHGDPIEVGTWREDAQGLPGVPEGFEDAWCAEIWPEEEES